jgi:hypothetical protein
VTGLGHKTWTRERLTAADLQGHLQDQVVLQYPSAAAADADLTEPLAGMVRWTADTDRYQGRTPGVGGIETGGAWRGFGRHWGTFAGAPPAPVSGNPTTPQLGDTAYLELWRCVAVVSYGNVWRQLNPAEVVTAAGLVTIRDAAAAAGVPMHGGFLGYVTGTDRLYLLRSSDSAWRLVGGSAGAAVTLTTGSGAPETGWGSHSGSLQHHGNGMATVTFDILRSGAAITPTTTGKITNSPLLTLPAGWEARSGTAIGQGANGNRGAFGYIGVNSRVITLIAVAGTADIATGATISLAGTYALAAPQDLTS